MPPTDAPPRRTQRERREATVSALLDATIATVAEIGYAATSVQAVCDRAGVSQGAAFRHFPTRIALVVAASEEVHRRLAAEFTSRLVATGTASSAASPARPLSSGEVRATLRILQDLSRSDLATVWGELFVAARTDPALRDAVLDALDRTFPQLLAAALASPLTDHVPDHLVPPLVLTLLQLFRGSATMALLPIRTELDDQQLVLAELLVRSGASALEADARSGAAS